MTANYLFRNLGGFRFEETGASRGSPCAADGGFQAGMGIACGDLDGDGLPDLAVTNYFGESTTFYRNLGGGLFADHTATIGLTAPSRPLLGFGIAFFDANNDGRLDLLTANGHVLDARPRFPWMMPLQLLLGGPGGRLIDGSKRAGPPFQRVAPRPRPGRRRPRSRRPARCARRRAERAPGLPPQRDGTARALHHVPARRDAVEPRRGGGPGRRSLAAAGRQVAQRHRRRELSLGGGPAAPLRARRRPTASNWVEVRWPSGRVDRFAPLEADAAYHLAEGSQEARPLRGWPGGRE